jgi:hypothetical protein
MHSFIKNSEGSYDVGVWLLSFHRPGTHEFHPIVQVSTLRGAIRTTNCLNGGNGNIDRTMEAAVPREPTNGGAKDHESTAKSAAVVRQARARAS